MESVGGVGHKFARSLVCIRIQEWPWHAVLFDSELWDPRPLREEAYELAV